MLNVAEISISYVTTALAVTYAGVFGILILRNLRPQSSAAEAASTFRDWGYSIARERAENCYA